MIAPDDTWRAFHGLQGGLVLAWLLEGATSPGGLDPVAVSAHFLRAVDAAPAGLESDELGRGRSTGSTAVRLRQDGRLLAHAIISLGQPDKASTWAPARDLAGLPRPETVERFIPPMDFVPFGQHVDIRPVGGSLPGSGGDEPGYDAWIRLRDDDVMRTLGPWGTAAVLLDAMPPGLLGIWTEPRPVPTVELSAHFAPAIREESAWWHITHHTRWGGDTTCVDETELHLPDGRLVAQARQHRRIV